MPPAAGMSAPLRFADLPRPDYAGGSLVNLMASLIRARGGRSPHRALAGLPPAALRPYSKVVLLLLDGLGANQLHAFVTRGKGRQFFARHPWQILTTACPPTTAAVVTTLATGASPAEHAILGWHLNLPDLGMVGTLLPFITRTDTPIAPADFPLERYLDIPAPIATMRGRRVLISYDTIPVSRTSLAQPWWTERRSFQTLDGMQRHLRAFARSRGTAYAYAYWPHYDTVCHRHGPEGRASARHLAELDAFLARVETALAGTGTLLLVTADHGHMQTSTHVDLSRIPASTHPRHPALRRFPHGPVPCPLLPSQGFPAPDPLRPPPRCLRLRTGRRRASLRHPRPRQTPSRPRQPPRRLHPLRGPRHRLPLSRRHGEGKETQSRHPRRPLRRRTPHPPLRHPPLTPAPAVCLGYYNKRDTSKPHPSASARSSPRPCAVKSSPAPCGIHNPLRP